MSRRAALEVSTLERPRTPLSNGRGVGGEGSRPRCADGLGATPSSDGLRPPPSPRGRRESRLSSPRGRRGPCAPLSNGRGVGGEGLGAKRADGFDATPSSDGLRPPPSPRGRREPPSFSPRGRRGPCAPLSNGRGVGGEGSRPRYADGLGAAPSSVGLRPPPSPRGRREPPSSSPRGRRGPCAPLSNGRGAGDEGLGAKRADDFDATPSSDGLRPPPSPRGRRESRLSSPTGRRD
jgi:hypothetical protein